MKWTVICLFLILLSAPAARAQNPEPKFIAETLVVQAEGSFEADPDLATLTFDISSEEKDLKTAYGKASQAIQQIVTLADKNGLGKEDVASGVLTVTPFYGGDRKKRAKSFIVRGQVTLKVRDFSKLGPLMDESVADEITDFRSLTYSLADEEAAKQRAVADAMKHAIGRANAALSEKGQKVGALRFANLDVKRLVGVTQFNAGAVSGAVGQVVEVTGGWVQKQKASLPPPAPLPQPEKISVSATVQCAFQIQ
jgi:uncharacterized protein YggE